MNMFGFGSRKQQQQQQQDDTTTRQPHNTNNNNNGRKHHKPQVQTPQRRKRSGGRKSAHTQGQRIPNEAHQHAADVPAATVSPAHHPPSSPVRVDDCATTTLVVDPEQQHTGGLGVEVSFHDKSPTSQQGAISLSAPPVTPQHFDLPASCVRLEEEMKRRKKVHRTQFSVDFPLLPQQHNHAAELPIRRRHRVPLYPTGSHHDDFDEDEEDDCENVLLLLQSQQVTDEKQAVKDELARTIAEMEALEEDRIDLETKFLRLPDKSGGRATDPRVWNVHYVLRTEKTLSMEDRIKLQKQRGDCFTFFFASDQVSKAFSSMCGARGNSKNTRDGPITLTPACCIDDGAAEVVGHVALMSGKDGKGAVFIGRDNDQASCHGHVPQRLFKQMKRRNMRIARDLVYLSTGPFGCYYAEFRGGECLWGNALRNDKHFERFVQEWDVYRVAFGPIQEFQENDRSWTTNSWIILGMDGRVAWRNLPARLHRTLESRLADWPALAEVSLGKWGSYFVRFLDGTVDYCLPGAIADVCDGIISGGASLTEIQLHPDLSQDYVIRHSEPSRYS